MLPNRSAYVTSNDVETKWMSYLIKDNELLRLYNGIWDKFSNSIR